MQVEIMGRLPILLTIFLAFIRISVALIELQPVIEQNNKTFTSLLLADSSSGELKKELEALQDFQPDKLVCAQVSSINPDLKRAEQALFSGNSTSEQPEQLSQEIVTQLAQELEQEIESSSNKLYYCACNKIYNSKEEFSQHIKQAHHATVNGKERYVCPGKQKNKDEPCAYTTKDISRFKIHLCTHTGKKEFACSECSKAFSSKNKLNEHIKRVHTPELNLKALYTFTDKPGKCACKAKYSSEKNFDKHLRKKHKQNKLFLCLAKECTHTAKKFSYIKDHIRTHTDERRYSCNNCSYTTTAEANVAKHVCSCSEHKN